MKPVTASLTHPFLRGPLMALAVALTLAACGSGDGDGDSAPPPPPQATNTAPTAAFTSTETAAAGEPVVFDASGSADADNDPLVYSWSFGNGLRGGGEQIAHVYDEPGTYTVRLTVDDGRGGSNVVERAVNVTPGAAATGSVDTLAVVRTATGTPLAGVSVSAVGGASAATDANGRAAVATLRSAPVTLKFSRDGYADQFKRLVLPTAAESGYVEVTMMPREAPLTLNDAADGGTLAGKDGVRITLPAGSLIDADGNPVGGLVQIAMTPVDVTADGRLFPGRYEGVGTDGTQGLIFSYGTVEFVLTQGGAPLQLAPGRKATIEIPVYATLDRDGRQVQVGDTYPLWSLNERTGTWVAEGTGTVVAATGTPSGLALRGDVTHFSWWNHDVFDSAQPYKPKPSCSVDTNYDGVPEDLSNTGYCSHEASPFWEDQQTAARSVDRARAAAGGRERAANEPQTPRFPAWVASAATPVGGGVELPVPAGLNVVFQSYALNGTLYARTVVNGASGVSEDVDIVLQPVQDATGTVSIGVPWNQVYAMSHVGEVDRFTITAAAGQNFAITGGRSNGSILSGSAVVRDPAGAVVGSSTLGSGSASITVTNAMAGTYTVEMAATSSAPGAYRLQALPVTASSSCTAVTALSLPSPTESHTIAGSSTRCFAVDLAADQVIDIDLPSRGGLSGALQLRAPNDEVIARDTFQSGSRTPLLRLGVAQAGTYQVEIVNLSTTGGTVQLRGGFITGAQVVSMPEEVTVTDMSSSDTRRYVLRQPTAGATFATALTACNGNFTAAVYPARTVTAVNYNSSCGSTRAVRIQAHATHPLVLPFIEVTRGSTTVTTPGEFTLITSTPTPLTLDTDVRLTAPERNRAVAYTFDGAAGQEVTIGTDIPGTSNSPVVAAINAPDGSLVTASGAPATWKLPTAGLYTVEVPNTSTYTENVRIRVNTVAPPVPLTLTSPLTERTDTLALGQVRVYSFDLNTAEVFRLRLASPDTLAATAGVGNVAPGTVSATLNGNTSPQFATSTQQGYARTTGTRLLVVNSSSRAEARSTGEFTVGIQKPEPQARPLGVEATDTVEAREMQAFGFAIPGAGYHLLRWRHTPVGASESNLMGTMWAPRTPFANYTGEFSLQGAENFGGSIVGERVALLQAGNHTLTTYNANASGSIDYTLMLIALAPPVDLTPSAAATAGNIAPAGERDYFRFTGVTGQSYTLNVTAGLGGNVYVRRLPGSGNHTDRAATTLATFPRALSAGVPLTATFTIPSDQGGTYIIEVDGAQDATGSYTVQLASP